MPEILFYLGSILLANYLVIQFGIINLGFIMFPAGAVCIGLTFSARDLVQRRYGKWGAWLWMLIATGITILFKPKIAVASGTAFLAAEAMDWLIYTFTRRPLAERIFLSNLLGTPLDSLIFVTMAFGFIWPAIWGQTVIKFLSSLIVIPFLYLRFQNEPYHDAPKTSA